MKKATPERKHYLDNLRMFLMLVLVPGHTPGLNILFPKLIYPWWYGLMFALAGITAYHSLKRRGAREFIKERTSKLLIPFLFAVLIFVRIEKYFFGFRFYGTAYRYDFWADLKNFNFLTTFSHFWFLLQLYPVAVLFAPIAKYLQRLEYRAKPENAGKASFAAISPWLFLCLFGIVILLMYNLIDPRSAFMILGDIRMASSLLNEAKLGLSILSFPVYFFLGYFALADEGMMEKLEKYCFLWSGIFAAAFILAHFGPAALRDVLLPMSGVLGCLAFLGLFRRYFNSDNSKLVRYLVNSSFAVFLSHNTYLAIFTYLFTMKTDNPLIVIPATILSTFALTFLTYELLKRFRATRWMFALRR